MRDVHGRLSAYFTELRDDPPETWGDSIARRCAEEDAAFRELLSRMLAEHRRLTEASAAGAAPAAAGVLPTHVGRLEVRRELGRGGTGVVYLAHDPLLQREVAVKVWRVDRLGGGGPSAGTHPAASREIARRMLFREAQITGGLQHPGILPIYEHGTTDDGIDYFTMRPLRPDDVKLRVVLDRRRGQPFARRKDLLEVFRSLCAAIAFAHERGVAHGDLKPDNVAVGPGGEVVVLDWGLAQILTADDGRCTVWARQLDDVGAAPPAGATLAYAAPEVLSGATRARDVATDVYALGVILFEVLTGSLPAGPGVGPALAALAVTDWPPDPSTWDPTVPGPLADLARRALDRHPHRRPGSPADVADEVRRWQEQDELSRRDAVRREEARSALLKAEATGGSARRHWIDHARSLLHGLAGDHADGEELETRLHRISERAEAEDRARARGRAGRRWLAALGVTLAVIGSIVGILVGERRRVEAERDRSADLLGQVEQLADARTVADLRRSADALWPADVEAVERMNDWVRRADELVGRRDLHAASLAALRRGGRRVVRPPVASLRDAMDRADLQADLADLDTALERWAGPTAAIGNRNWLADRRRRVAAQLAAATPPTDEVWEYDAAKDRWRDAVLCDILAGLDDVRPVTGEGGLREKMLARRTVAARAAGVDADGDDAWRQVIVRTQGSGTYARPPARPDPALVPLGPDPASGLEEFAVFGTGSIPRRSGGVGPLVRAVDFAVVLVLLPGGVTRRGSPDAPSPETEATADLVALRSDEHPARDIRVGPFYLSKYEVTQRQWARITEGERPSHEQGADEGFTDAHPVEMVPWTTATQWLGRYGLRLPREAEWEYACRAGTLGERYVERMDEFAKHANFADATLARNQPEEVACAVDQDDGHHFHAPVGSYLPNPFGLHDMYGNVSEWCRDVLDRTYYEYGRPVDPPGSTARYRIVERVHRGGNWADSPQFLRSADRRGLHEERASRVVGLRPARDLR